jgi:FixJ family two-component response regulator
MASRLPEARVISVIDDSEAARNGTVRLVRSLGFIVHAFPSAQTFLHSEQLTKTRCLISDIQMPRMNGIQLHDTLRARGYDIPIIFVTAYYNEEIRAEALDRGAICILSKPLDGETLLSCLNRALQD